MEDRVADVEERRSVDAKLNALYDALIGAPGKVGALEEMRMTLAALSVRVTGLELGLKNHEAEHDEEQRRDDETRKSIGGVLLRLAERAIVAAVSALVALIVALQTFLQGGQSK